MSALLLSCAPERITITIQTGGPPTLSGGAAAHFSRSCPGELKAWGSAGWDCRNGHPRGRGLDPPVGAIGTGWCGGPSDLCGETMRASLATVPTSSARSRTPEFCGETAQVDAARRQSAGVPVALTLCSANSLTVAHGAGALPEHGVCRLSAAPNHLRGWWPASSGPRPPCRRRAGVPRFPSLNRPLGSRHGCPRPGERIGTAGIPSRRFMPRCVRKRRPAAPPPGQGPGRERKDYAADCLVGGADRTVPPRD